MFHLMCADATAVCRSAISWRIHKYDRRVRLSAISESIHWPNRLQHVQCQLRHMRVLAPPHAWRYDLRSSTAPHRARLLALPPSVFLFMHSAAVFTKLSSIFQLSDCFFISDCKQYPTSISYWSSEAIPFVISCTVLLVATVLGAIDLTMHQDHPVVKGTSLPFSLLILLGIFMCLGTIFILYAPPASDVCDWTQIVFYLGCALIVASLAIKTWRIWRIFEAPMSAYLNKAALTNGRLISVVLLVVSVQLAVLIAVASNKPVGTTFDLVNNDEYGERRLTCDQGVFCIRGNNLPL